MVEVTNITKTRVKRKERKIEYKKKERGGKEEKRIDETISN